MLRRFLPISTLFLAAALFSCGGQQASNEETSDTTQVASNDDDGEGHDAPQDIPDSLDVGGEEGNPDGDIFRTDALENAISGETEQPDPVKEYGTEEEEELEEHVSPSETLAEVCGFSPDGKYFAFVAVDRGDGYGPGTGYVYVIDVAKNEWATRPATYQDTTGAEDVDEKTAALRDNLLKKYGIKNQANMGYGYGYIGINPNNVILVNEDRYTLDFKSDNGKIDLRLKGNGKDIVLQKDSKVPASRGTARRSRLNKAYVLGDKIAVFVEYDGGIETGFENERYFMRKNIVVTAVIPK